MENPIKMDDLGGNNPIFGNIHINKSHKFWGWKPVYRLERGLDEPLNRNRLDELKKKISDEKLEAAQKKHQVELR